MAATDGSHLEGLTAQTLARVPIVAGWIVEGRSRHEILDCGRENWGLSVRQVDRLIAYARAELVASWHVQREELTAILMERLDREYRTASGQSNPGAAVAAIMAQARLARL